MKTIILITLLFTQMGCRSSTNNDMGFFDKIFGKDSSSNKKQSPAYDTTQLVKTAKMLDEDLYWKIVDQSARLTNTQHKQERFLINEIEKLTPEQMIGFRLRTDKLLYDTYNSEMWCAGYIMNGGCSDDGFEYFRNWVISRGKETYYKAKENPDYLIKEVDGNLDEYDFESFWYVALEAFKNVTGKDLYDYVDYDNFILREGKYPQFEFTWQEDNPESLKKICPKLYRKLME